MGLMSSTHSGHGNSRVKNGSYLKDPIKPVFRSCHTSMEDAGVSEVVSIF